MKMIINLVNLNNSVVQIKSYRSACLQVLTEENGGGYREIRGLEMDFYTD